VRSFLQFAETGSRQVAGNAVDTGAVRTIRCETDLDHGLVETCPFGKAHPDRRIFGQIDNAVMLVGEFQFALRTHHAEAFHVPDLANRQCYIEARDIVARLAKHANKPGAGVGRTADDLDRVAFARIHLEHTQPIGVWVLFGFQNPGNLEWLQPVGAVGDLFDFQPDHGKAFHDLFQAGIGFQVLLEPGKCEFHLRYSLSHVRRARAANSVVERRQLPNRFTSGSTVASP